MKKHLLLFCSLFLFLAAQAQTVNFVNMCVLNITIDTTGTNELNVTIYNGDTVHVNYPTVVVVNTSGDTVGNINNNFYLFAQLPGDTVTHVIPTSLDSLPTGFTCSVYFTDQVWDTTYMFSYPMSCTVGINEAYVTGSINVYPNPATDNITIDMKKPANQQARITIYDITGKELKSYSTPDDRLSINRDGLENGMYFITVVTNKQRYTSKLIVK